MTCSECQGNYHSRYAGIHLIVSSGCRLSAAPFFCAPNFFGGVRVVPSRLHRRRWGKSDMFCTQWDVRRAGGGDVMCPLGSPAPVHETTSSPMDFDSGSGSGSGWIITDDGDDLWLYGVTQQPIRLPGYGTVINPVANPASAAGSGMRSDDLPTLNPAVDFYVSRNRGCQRERRSARCRWSKPLMQLEATITRCSSHGQSGSSLIEVVVSILLLSFGILAIGLTMGFAVQMPKLSGFHATAVDLANNYVERMRANPGALSAYIAISNSYDGTQNQPTAVAACPYPSCTPAGLVVMDSQQIQFAARRQLPGGGVLATCDDGTCTDTIGNIGAVWQQPDGFSAINSVASDNCPLAVASYTPRPQCLYVRFKL